MRDKAGVVGAGALHFLDRWERPLWIVDAAGTSAANQIKLCHWAAPCNSLHHWLCIPCPPCRQAPLLSMFSAPGPTPDAAVRAVSKAAVIAWFDAVTSSTNTPGSGSSSSVPSMRQRLEGEGAAFKTMAPGTTSTIR